MLHHDAVPPTCPIFYWKCDPGPSVQLCCGIAHGMQVLVMQRDSHGRQRSPWTPHSLGVWMWSSQQ